VPPETKVEQPKNGTDNEVESNPTDTGSNRSDEDIQSSNRRALDNRLAIRHRIVESSPQHCSSERDAQTIILGASSQ